MKNVPYQQIYGIMETVAALMIMINIDQIQWNNYQIKADKLEKDILWREHWPAHKLPTSAPLWHLPKEIYSIWKPLLSRHYLQCFD